MNLICYFDHFLLLLKTADNDEYPDDHSLGENHLLLWILTSRAQFISLTLLCGSQGIQEGQLYLWHVWHVWKVIKFEMIFGIENVDIKFQRNTFYFKLII